MKKKVWEVTFLLIFFLMTASSHIFAQDYIIHYKCGQTEDLINKVKPQFRITNNSAAAVALSTFTVRYYFSTEGYVNNVLSVDYAAVGSSNVIGTFYPDYIEVKFSAGAGTLAAGGNSGDIQLRIEKDSHGNYIQSNDYSFMPEAIDWSLNNRVTLYSSGSLVSGTVPPPPPAPTAPPPVNDDWLHAQGGTLKDKNNDTVRITGINWFGFETTPLGLGGLQAVNFFDTLNMLASKGFNTLRIPLSLQIVRNWMAGVDVKVNFVNGLINPVIDGITGLTLLDVLVNSCKTYGLKLIFDMHTIDQTDIQKKVWYNASYSYADFQGAWIWLAKRYKNDDTVIGMDLFNEPHGQFWTDGNSGAIWDGSTLANNWRKAAGDTAALILAENPELLIFVEGIESTPVPGGTYGTTDKYQYICNWWGGNLREVINYPVNAGVNQDQIVYSAHDYGPLIYVQPWFQHPFTQTTLYDECWRPNWFYIVEQNIAPMFIGEWGGKLDGGDNQAWLSYLSQFIKDKSLNHTFWCFNPDSSDTGGIVDSLYVFDTAKYNIIEKSLWKDASNKYIGLDHVMVLSSSSTGTNVAIYYNNVVATTPPPATVTPSRTSTRTATLAATRTATSAATATATGAATRTVTAGTATRTPTGTVTRTGTATRSATGATATRSATRTTTISVTPTRTATIASTPTRTATGATQTPGSCTCDSGCSTLTIITPNFTKDGTGQFCFEAASLGSYINSWNLINLKVNGVELANVWTAAASLPAQINGKYYVYYNSTVSYGHFEAMN